MGPAAALGLAFTVRGRRPVLPRSGFCRLGLRRPALLFGGTGPPFLLLRPPGLGLGLLDPLSATLVESRWQRDLTDSTTQRNIGSALGYSLLALTNLMGGLESIHPNTHVIERELDENWEVLGEPIQTAMRACELKGLPGMDKPYEKVKELMRGHTINKEQVEQFIDQQSFDPETAARLKALTPATYTGVASQLVAFGR